MSKEEKQLIFKLYEEKMKLKKNSKSSKKKFIISTIPIKKKLKEYEELYRYLIKIIKDTPLAFSYLCLDELS